MDKYIILQYNNIMICKDITYNQYINNTNNNTITNNKHEKDILEIKNRKEIIQKIKNKLENNIDNPKLKIETININNQNTNTNRNINIVQDGYLIAGTKQRVAQIFIKSILKNNKNNKIDTLLYAGSINGFGPVATAYCAFKLGLKCHVFLGGGINNWKTNTNTRQINTLIALNSKITICPTYRNARKMEFKLSNNPSKKWNTLPNYFIVPMGLNDDNNIMVNLLAKQIKKASIGTIMKNNNKKYRIWCVAGSGGIVHALSLAFPKSEFHIYLTGGGGYRKKVIDWSKKHNNITILNDLPELKYNYNDRKKYYSSVREYDDLIWPYVKKYAQDGDIIWNVSSDDYLFL